MGKFVLPVLCPCAFCCSCCDSDFDFFMHFIFPTSSSFFFPPLPRSCKFTVMLELFFSKLSSLPSWDRPRHPRNLCNERMSSSESKMGSLLPPCLLPLSSRTSSSSRSWYCQHRGLRPRELDKAVLAVTHIAFGVIGLQMAPSFLELNSK